MQKNKVGGGMPICPKRRKWVVDQLRFLDMSFSCFRLRAISIIVLIECFSQMKSYPYQSPWDDVFSDTKQPLLVDIGSGNGLLLFQMARNWEGSNFLGLEINEKLVVRCLQNVASAGKRNLYFLSTKATSTFRLIVSSYPRQLTLVAIQCPNTDFNKEQNRWRMVRRMLVEAVADLLHVNEKIYLQSDVESVLLGMKEQFISHGKGQLEVDSDDSGNGRMENPFGVVSDWERHVPMSWLAELQCTERCYEKCEAERSKLRFWTALV
ncbi:tRNA (guanine-N(7)-)-methyltransferase-like [Triticum dicoccoides]|uniref:tRNA (guanine-N(7)-)-methyltransferase-like n=1 Tax=Triticum dicoccoides TaxID=85692 RepID=UPI0018909BE8|nr:tRNA (guanine-N(7)-)-methyltransferase-like [Triticum dicoccoides]XP_037477330.1 tRNA (guanine-N(7)-)-methyltransferase-like [Triticum dicoccoides]